MVSVLVTVYNREDFLSACLSSILASTWKDFEVIVVDDASSDSSYELAQQVAGYDHRIHVYRNSVNLGDYPNRNQAAAYARGKYLKFVDHDDIIYPHSLDLMVGAMEHHAEAGLGLSWNVIDPPRPYPFASTPAEVYLAHYLGTSLLGVGPSASIIRREAFLNVEGFGRAQFVGDSDLWLRLCNRLPLVSLPPSLVWWRRHAGQQMSIEHANVQILNDRFTLERLFLAHSPHLSIAEKAVALSRLNRRHTRRLFSLAVREWHPMQAARLWRQTDLSLVQTIEGLLPIAEDGANQLPKF